MWALQLLDLEARMDAPFHTAWGDWLRGLISLCRGARSEAEPSLDRAVYLAQQAGYPEAEVWCHQMLGRAHLDRGERKAALQRYRRAAALCTPEMFGNWRAREMRAYALVFASVLGGLEGAFADPTAFRAFCQRFPGREQMIDGAQVSPDLDELALGQWFLDSAAPAPGPGASDAGEPLLDVRLQSLNTDRMPAGWTWHDPFGDCRYALQQGLAIEAANGRDLWVLNQSAPRLMVAAFLSPSMPTLGISVETICAPAAADRPAMGGLLLWIDPANYLRLDRGLSGPNEITLIGCLQDRDMILGRGRLPPEPAGVSDRLDRAWLRFEWHMDQVRALCSADGETWYTVGQVALAFDASAQFGLYACGNIDRTIYHGAYPEGAALRFESLRAWQFG
jgi:hypothetical protein